MRNILIATLPEDQTRSGEKMICENIVKPLPGSLQRGDTFPGVDQGCGTSTADGPAKSLEFNQQHVAREGTKKIGWRANEKLINVYRPKKHDLHSTLSILSFQSPSVRTFNLHSLAYPKMIFGRPKTYFLVCVAPARDCSIDGYKRCTAFYHFCVHCITDKSPFATAESGPMNGTLTCDACNL